MNHRDLSLPARPAPDSGPVIPDAGDSSLLPLPSPEPMPTGVPEARRGRLFPGQVRLRTLLVVIPLFGILPLVLFAGTLLLLVWDAQQRELRRDLQSSVRALSVAVDRELSSSLQRLEMLAALSGIGLGGAPGDPLAMLQAQAGLILERNPDWGNLTLTDPTGRQMLNVLGQGRPLPSFLRDHHRVVFELGRPAVSDLFVPREQQAGSAPLTVAVSVPVRVDGQIRYALSARLDPVRLARLLQAQQLRNGGVAAIYDRQLRIVARNRDTERHIGRTPVNELLDAMRGTPSGTLRTRTLDAPPVIGAWERTEAGWAVAVGFPVEVYEAPLRRSIWGLAVVGMLVLGLGLLAAVLIARKVSGAVASAGASARLLAAGQPVAPRSSGIMELARLFDLQQQAGKRLAASLAQRDAAEAERGRLLESERQARAEAEAANRGKDEFLAMLGHELRNPLNAIGNGLRVLERPEVGDDIRARTHEMLRRQSGHLKRMVDDLLDVGRVLTGKIRITRERMDLADAVDRCVVALRAAGLLEQHALRLRTESVLVEGDATRLEQVVSNLLTNAVKYTPPGGHVELRLARHHDEAVLTVQDDGIGMSPELARRVFDLFVQGDQELHRATGGLGIGLTLSRRLVELHGGRIEAESDGPGRGSRFTVRLPLAE